ncbi:MAG: M48 family metallopeptidase [Thermodesulfobacteriota bacterium]
MTRPAPTVSELEETQLAALNRHPHHTWRLERVSRVFLRLLATVPQVHGRTYPFLGFDWWVTATGKIALDNVWSPSPAHDAGLRQGDVLLAVNNWPLYPEAAAWDKSMRLTRDVFLYTLPGEILVAIMLDLKHLGMEARGRYLTGPVELLVQRDREKFSVTLYPQHLPAEYAIGLATANQKINAYAAPGKIILSQRLVNFCRTDDELALVIGHELAHQVLGHRVRQEGQKKLGRLAGEVIGAFTTLTLRQLIQFDSVPGLERDLRRVAPLATVSVFSREDELEADAYGLWYAYQAGYDVEAAPAVLERLAAVHDKDPFMTTYFLDSHPSSLERLARLKKIAKYFQAGQAARIFLQTADLDRKPPPN